MRYVFAFLAAAGAFFILFGLGVLMAPPRGRTGRLLAGALLAAWGSFLLIQSSPRLVRLRPRASPLPARDLEGEVDAIVRPRLGSGRHVGLVVGIVGGGEKKLFAYGERVLGSGRPPDGETVFPIGSVTKLFTGLLLAEMAKRGEVGLDDPVRLYLPTGAAPGQSGGREVTLLHLATHTSGLPRLPERMWATRDFLTLRFIRNPYAGFTAERLFERLPRIPLRRTPGASFSYSNLGMGLLGHALERAADTSYADLVRTRLSAPLGLRDTEARLSADQRRRLAPGYHGYFRLAHLGITLRARPWDLPALHGAGALFSTAHDLLRFMEAALRPPPCRRGPGGATSRSRARRGAVSEGLAGVAAAPAAFIPGWR